MNKKLFSVFVTLFLLQFQFADALSLKNIEANNSLLSASFNGTKLMAPAILEPIRVETQHTGPLAFARTMVGTAAGAGGLALGLSALGRITHGGTHPNTVKLGLLTGAVSGATGALTSELGGGSLLAASIAAGAAVVVGLFPVAVTYGWPNGGWTRANIVGLIAWTASSALTAWIGYQTNKALKK